MTLKSKLAALLFTLAAVLPGTSGAATVTIRGVANGISGLVTLNGNNVTGRTIYVSTTGTSVRDGAYAAFEPFIGSTGWSTSQFDLALATLIGTTTPSSPGIVASGQIFNGSMNSSHLNTEVGNLSNTFLMFVLAESAGTVTGIGIYSYASTPPEDSGSSVTFSRNTVSDVFGTSVASFEVIPEPSTALLGIAGLSLAALRRRR